MNNTFDVVVIGGGHAGIEAAYAAAKAGSRTALITLKTNKIGHMPCNPAVGGIGKGHIVYEISALGGVMPRLCSKSYLQARMLNTKKGPAVQGLRLQIDKYLYAKEAQQFLQTVPNLTIIEDRVEDLLVDQKIAKILGVKTVRIGEITSKAVIVTTGTFLRGLIHIGTHNESAGRQGEEAVFGLSASLKNLGFHLGRLKTGTPPRLLRSSLDFSKMTRQADESLSYLFEFYPQQVTQKEPCYMTYTNEKTHEIIRANLHKSAMYNGNIKGVGPRYCPSIEDKIGRFADKLAHLVFVEPESMVDESGIADEIYPNGLSTSLPEDVQLACIRSISGFENADIKKPGYAVEYDFAHPNQLHHSLETKKIQGLFLAGQINGTTGYEEAAGQGVVAGINAHLKVQQQEAMIFDRHESYLGIMIDDLVTRGVDEPYRMFTSRAECRLILRQDNVFYRLSQKGFDLGLIDTNLYQDIKKEQEVVQYALQYLQKTVPRSEASKRFGTTHEDIPVLKQYLLQHTDCNKSELSGRALLSIHAEIRYGPYIEREKLDIKRQQQYRNLGIPDNFEYTDLPGLSKELQQKLGRQRPKTIEEASLISGMTPAAISLLIFKVNQKQK
jgi:tRNA uridine 5-carboxymethylaminomethyl modification enzyme